MFERIGMGDDHIEHKMLSRGIENAQKRIENRNFDARKNLLEYDDVSNDQRQAIYSLRNQLLEEEDISETIETMIHREFERISNDYVPIESIESQWKGKELEEYLKENYGLSTDINNEINKDKSLLPESIAIKIIEMAMSLFSKKYSQLGENRLLLEKQVMLQVLDVHWKEHLAEIDHLRGSIGLRAYAQKNPKNEFKREAYSMFENMLDEIDIETVRILFSLQIANEEVLKDLKKESDDEIVLEKPDHVYSDSQESDQNIREHEKSSTTQIKREEPKFGRNEIVKITNGSETREMKYKKAAPMIETGEWKII